MNAVNLRPARRSPFRLPALLLAGAALLLSRGASAEVPRLPCDAPLPAGEAFAAAEVVFAGRVTAIAATGDGRRATVTFAVEAAWKGDPGPEALAGVPAAWTAEGEVFAPGERVLVYALRREGRLTVDACLRSAPLRAAPVDLYRLGAPAWQAPAARLPEVTLSALLDRLEDPLPTARMYAARTLGEIGDSLEVVFPRLVAYLEQARGLEREIACRALGDLGPDALAAEPALSSVLRTGRSGERRAAAEALAAIGPDYGTVRLWLLRLVEDPAEETRAAALRCMVALAPDSLAVVGELVPLLWTEEGATRAGAAHMLGVLAPQDAVTIQALAMALGDEDLAVRREAARSLGNIGPAALDARPMLEEAMRRETVRAAALGDSTAAEAMEMALLRLRPGGAAAGGGR